MTETPRERFLRNHQENVRIMRAALIRAERDGREEDAEIIRGIVSAWESVAEVAQSEG